MTSTVLASGATSSSALNLRVKHRRAAVFSALLAAFATLGAVALTPSAFALTWDTVSGDDSTITDGSGDWNTTQDNLMWNGSPTNVAWSQISTTAGEQTAVFGSGTDGTVDQWTVTLGSQMAATSLTFNNTGYLITGSPLALINSAGTASGALTVSANKTATINSTLRYPHNVPATITVNSGSVLNLGGGTATNFNPQFTFTGTGTLNLTGGTYTQNVGSLNTAVINLTGGTHAITPGSGVGATIGINVPRSVNYTVSGTGTLTVNGNNGGGSNSFLSLGSSTSGNTSYTNTLTVQSGGTVNIGTTASRAGELRIAGNTGASGKLDVQGGTVTIGTGNTANRIYFFRGGSGPGYTASMTQSGGNVTANGIQFGGPSGTYNAASSATLQLSAGNLYVGLQGIARGAAATDLPVTIQLQGGTLGASADWTSALDMKLGNTTGGPTIRAADALGTARDITLSGNLSDDGSAVGTLTKTGTGTLTLSGTNTYTGNTTVSEGTLIASGPGSLPATGALQVASNANVSLADGIPNSTTTGALTLADRSSLAFDWNAGSGDTLISTAAATTSGTVAISITSISSPDAGGTLISSPSGGLDGATYFLANNTNFTASLSVTGTTVGIGTQSAVPALTDAYWVGGQLAGAATGAMALSSGTSSNWASDAAGTSAGGVVPGASANVIFGAAGATQQALVTTGANLNLASLTFNDSAAVTIAGTHTIALGSTLATPATSSGAGATVTPGSAITVTPFASATNTINANLRVSDDQTWNIPSGKALTIGGAVLGAGTVTMADEGSLVFAGPSAFTGKAIVSAGSVGLTGNGTLGSGALVTLNGGFLDLGGTTQTAGAVSITAPATFGDTIRNGTLAGTSLTFNNESGNAIISANLAGTGGLTKSGNGTVTLTGNNSYTGTTNVSAGILDLSGLTGTGVSLVKAGAGTLVLSGTNTYTGNTTISAGTLRLVSTTAIPGNGTLAVGANRLEIGTDTPFAYTGAMSASNNATFVSDRATPGAGVTHTLLLSGNLALTHGTTLNFLSGDNVTGGTAVIQLGNLTCGSASDGTVTLNPSTATLVFTNYTGLNTGVSTLALSGDTTGNTVSGVIANGNRTAQSVVKSGTGTWTLLGNNTYTGNTTINSGILQIGNGTDSGSIAATSAITNDAELVYNVGTGVRTLAAPISGTGSLIQNSAGGTLTLTANNTYTGNTTVNFGTLGIQGGHDSPTTLAAGTVLQLDVTKPVTSTSTLTFTGNASVRVLGTPVPATTNILFTATSISGTPALSAPVPGFTLVNTGTVLQLEFSGGGDFTPPVIATAPPAFVNWGSVYVDVPPIATDETAPANPTVSTSGTVNTAKPGVYTLTYNAQDAAGNNAVAVQRTVTVSIANPTAVGADGYSPLMKYALGATSPSGTVEAPVLGTTATDLTLTAVVRTDDAKLTVVCKTNTDLTQAANWTATGVTVTASSNQVGVPTGCVRNIYSVPLAAKKFLRLEATLTP